MLAALILAVGMMVPGESAADAVILRDGKEVLGQWVEPAPRGKALVIVRRAWAEKAMPQRLKAWEAAEAPWIKRARAERIARLEAWKRDGAPAAISSWIDSEIERLKKDDAPPPLMVAILNRSEVRKVTRAKPGAARKLRQAWRAGFADAETAPLDDLTSMLEGRGFPMTGDDPVAIDDLLPMATETDAHWMARRAATEVANDPGQRFLGYQGMILPEGVPGAAPVDAVGLLGGSLKTLLGDGPAEDPLAAKGRELAAKGRAGLLVTSLVTAEDLSGVTVEVTLYARTNGDRWEKAASCSAGVRTEEVGDRAGDNLKNDPQVDSVFKIAEGLGLPIPDDLKQKSLNIGAATQMALGKARTAIQPDLDALALPVTDPRAVAP